MRKLIALGGVGAAVAIGVTLWQRQDRVSTQPSMSAMQVETKVAVPSVAPPPDAARPSRSVEDIAARDEQVAAEPSLAELDDGDDHGQAQGELHSFEEPPPSRDAFGANTESETAALAEVRATLEALLNDQDPAVKEQASALLETIAVP
jgi:hypothetical protein